MKFWNRPKTHKNDIFGFQNDHFWSFFKDFSLFQKFHFPACSTLVIIETKLHNLDRTDLIEVIMILIANLESSKLGITDSCGTDYVKIIKCAPLCICYDTLLTEQILDISRYDSNLCLESILCDVWPIGKLQSYVSSIEILFCDCQTLRFMWQ